MIENSFILLKFNYILPTEDDLIRRFLLDDKCKMYADSYLLAMVFTYFLRAGFSHAEFNKENFFIAL